MTPPAGAGRNLWFRTENVTITLVATDSAGVVTRSAPVSLLLDPAARNGATAVTVRIVDRAGHENRNDLTLTVDDTAPTGTFRPSGTYLRGTFTAWPYESADNIFVLSMSSYLDDHRGGGTTNRQPFSVRVDSKR